MIKKLNLIILAVLAIAGSLRAQQVALTRDQIIAITSEWKGDRLPDGRPNIPDALLKRKRNISLEEAWGILRNKGYNNQFEGDWMLLRADQSMWVISLTVQYLPKLPDFYYLIREKGKTEKLQVTTMQLSNSLPTILSI